MPAPFFMLYLISVPSPALSLISRESTLYPLFCAMNVPFTTGALPSDAGSSTGTMVAGGSVLSDGDGAAFSGTLAAPALARSVRCNAFPVPRGSMPYSAGRTAVTSRIPAMSSAITVAVAILFRDGGWTLTTYDSSLIFFVIRYATKYPVS